MDHLIPAPAGAAAMGQRMLSREFKLKDLCIQGASSQLGQRPGPARRGIQDSDPGQGLDGTGPELWVKGR